MRISYRKLELNDLDKVYQLGCEIIDNDTVNQLNWHINNISDVLSKDQSSSYVAHIKKIIVGFLISIVEEDLKRATIYWIGTQDKYKKFGIESKLLKNYKRDMDLKGIKDIRIFIEKEKVDLIKKIMYIGFREKKQLLEFELNSDK